MEAILETLELLATRAMDMCAAIAREDRLSAPERAR
jgi:hypothetical protein